MRRVASVLVGLLLLSGCGGDDDSTSSIDDDDDPVEQPDPVATDAADRPEGAWTMVSTQLTRSDFADLVPGVASVAMVRFEPSCASGPCDLVRHPAGVAGSYQAEGEPAAPGAVKAEPSTWTWNEADETYRTTNETVASCTTAAGEVIDDAYVSTRTRTVTFTAGGDDRPAQLVGDYELVVEVNPDVTAPDCTPYSETGSITATPTDAVDIAEIDLTGEYVATESVVEVLPAGQRDPGFVGSLGTFTIDGRAIRGLLDEPAELTGSGDTLGGETAAVSQACATEPETPDGYTATESFADLRVAALTDEGDPIVIGTWTVLSEPTPAGVDGGCPLSRNTGFLVLVPAGSLD